MQLYRSMDIGTAKPTPADRLAIAHHGLDLVDPWEECTVGEYARHASGALAEIARRSATAVIVGGTGLYLRSLTDPMELPGRWPEIRAELEARAETEAPEVMHAELAALDPVAAARIEPSNVRRTVRALEVCRGSGRPFSSFGPGLDQYPPIAVAQIGIRWARPALAARIAARVTRMLDAGLIDEVRQIDDALRLAGRAWSRTARQALGYREVLDHLAGRTSATDMVDEIVLRTRQFSVRQERWFRRDPRIQWVDVDSDPVAEVAPVVLARLEQRT
jgi:tRNA dimethylallyltransferase